MQYVNLILSSKIFFEKSEFENQINLIKYALLIEIRHFYTPPPPLPYSFNEENSGKFENYKFG